MGNFPNIKLLYGGIVTYLLKPHVDSILGV